MRDFVVTLINEQPHTAGHTYPEEDSKTCEGVSPIDPLIHPPAAALKKACKIITRISIAHDLVACLRLSHIANWADLRGPLVTYVHRVLTDRGDTPHSIGNAGRVVGGCDGSVGAGAAAG